MSVQSSDGPKSSIRTRVAIASRSDLNAPNIFSSVTKDFGSVPGQPQWIAYLHLYLRLQLTLFTA